MTYSETIEYLYSQLPVYHRIGKAAYKADLKNTIALDDYFGSPHKKYATVHVGGTNGKGSVSHLIASVLQEAGYRTGLYTSPHLRDYRERIRVNGEMIPEEEVVKFVENHGDQLRQISPSFFEMSVAMAFDWFARSQVEVAVIEVGLGGRLDSTNIISPLLSVITNIGYDHMDLLGDSLEKIAIEKAGIIKPGIPVVIGEEESSSNGIFISRAHDLNTEIVFADRVYKLSWDIKDQIGGVRGFTLVNRYSGTSWNGVTPLTGNYQSSNLITATTAVDKLKKKFEISCGNLLDGIANVVRNTGLSGRWQLIGTRPLTICDTGHNSHGLRHVIEQLSGVSKKNLHIVIGFVRDKDLDTVLTLFPGNAHYYFTKASVPRALDEKLLEYRAASYGLFGSSYPAVADALRAAREAAGEDDVIFVGGSTFVVAEVI